VQTAPSGRARIAFAGEDTVELAGNTHLTIMDLHNRPISRAQVILLALEEGALQARTSASLLPGRRFEIETRVATVHAKGGQFVCTILDGRRVQVEVHEGAATLSMGAESLEIAAGQRAEAELGRPLALEAAQPTRSGAAFAPGPTLPRSTQRPTLTDREKTLFPPVLTPTRPGDEMELYTVAAGDTLYSISARFGVSWERVWEANRATLASPELIQVGQELRIPRP
jgi:nucleoid-associated protein YgaU